MEVHAHTHSPRKKWTHYLWEFMMLFLAVYLGFFAENLREHKIESQRAKKYAILLKADLINDTFQLNNLMGDSITMKKMLIQSKNILDKSQNEITVGDLRQLSEQSFSLEYFIPRDATYSQLKNSGNLRLFTNLDISVALSQYESALKHFTDIRQLTMSGMGGIQSEHILQHDISIYKFLKRSINNDSLQSARKAGYNFRSWDESNKIKIDMAEIYENFNELLYPTLKYYVIQIIQLLNKEYNLK